MRTSRNDDTPRPGAVSGQPSGRPAESSSSSGSSKSRDSEPPPGGSRPHDGAPLLLVERIVALGRGWSRRQHELCGLLARYDLSGDWAFSGSVTCSRWAADALEVEIGTAREWLRVGHALRELADIDEAFASGALSFSKVRVLTRVAVDHPDRQAELVALAVGCTAAALPWELARWSEAEEDPIERDRRHRREMSLSVRTEPDGSAVITARLPPVDAATAMAAIDAAMHRGVGSDRVGSNLAGSNLAGSDQLGPSASATGSATATTAPTATGSGDDATADADPPRTARRPSLGARRAAAFVGLLTSDQPSGAATELLIHLRGDGATLSDGTPVAGHLVERLAPEAFFRALVHDADRRPINASARQRHPTTRQRRVVASRDDHTCTAPGCDARQFLEVDHDPPYEVTKRTVVDELRLRCGFHHRQRHSRDDSGAPPGS